MGVFSNSVNKYTFTENGSLSFKTSGSACLDLFAQIGGLRNRDTADIIKMFANAFNENPEYALRILLFSRDIRKGGLGEKRVYRTILSDMLSRGMIDLESFADITVEYGSWKDIFEICDDEQVSYIVRRELSRRVAEEECKPNLMEKYMFSIGGKNNGRAEKLARTLGLTPKQYRKYLSKARADLDIVETHMCANDWNSIIYEHVPSKANLNYSSAFRKHDTERYSQYLNDVNDGKKKINAGTLYPYEVVKKTLEKSWSMTNEYRQELDTLWKNIKDYKCDGNSIVVCDTSGSMMMPDYTPLSMSVSLTIYFAERNIGKFKGQMITFSDKPSFFEIPEGDIFKKVNRVSGASWGMNTDLNAVFDLMLTFCKRDNVPAEEMPKRVVIISDMQFDIACRGKTNFDAIKEQYAEAGYDMPEVVFWNVNARPGCLPVEKNENGVALVSGASPSLFENIAEAKELDPIKFMLDAIMKPQYDCAVELLKG